MLSAATLAELEAGSAAYEVKLGLRARRQQRNGDPRPAPAAA